MRPRLNLGSFLVAGSFLILLLTVVFGVILRPATAATTATFLEAERFIIRDRSGRICGVLGTYGDGGASLRLRGPNGETRVSLSTVADGSSALHFRGPDLKTSFVVVFGSSGEGQLMLIHPDGQARITMRLFHESAPEVQVHGHEGDLVFQTPSP